VKVLEGWESRISASSHPAKDNEWAITFSVLLIIILVIDKALGSAYYCCKGKIQYSGCNAEEERARFEDLARLTQTVVFERFKERFHKKFKTRQGGEESCNTIRGGVKSFNGKSKCIRVDNNVKIFVRDLRSNHRSAQ
jgi:hypothetical protein